MHAQNIRESAFGSRRVDPSSRTPYSDATLCRKRPKSAHVNRPMNSFMVFAQIERNRMLETNPNLHNAEISKRLGMEWKLMSVGQKKPYMEEAQRLKLFHQAEFPGYKYRPRKNSKAPTTADVEATSVRKENLFGTTTTVVLPHGDVGSHVEDPTDMQQFSEEPNLGEDVAAGKLLRSNVCRRKRNAAYGNCSTLNCEPDAKIPYSPEEAIGTAASPTVEASGFRPISEDVWSLPLDNPATSHLQTSMNRNSDYDVDDSGSREITRRMTEALIKTKDEDDNNNIISVNGESDFRYERLPHIDFFRNDPGNFEIDGSPLLSDIPPLSFDDDLLPEFACYDSSLSLYPCDSMTVLNNGHTLQPDDLLDLNPEDLFSD